MAIYSFAVPILPGKTENWKRYVQEMRGQRREEFNSSRQRHGLRMEQVWLQKTPNGDIAVVTWDVDNPAKTFENFMKSNDSFDQWFRDKILIECHGMNQSDQVPPLNEVILNFTSQPVGEKRYAETRKK
jgi:hypothetical protein